MGSSPTFQTGFKAAIFLRCMSDEVINGQEVQIYDLIIKNVTLSHGLENATASLIVLDDDFFKEPFHIIRSLNGSIVDLKSSQDETTEALEIKKGIVEHYQLSFQYTDGNHTAHETGVMNKRKNKYMANKEGQSRIIVDSGYDLGDVTELSEDCSRMVSTKWQLKSSNRAIIDREVS